MPKGGKRKGSGRPPTGKAKTAMIQIRVDPKLKEKAISRSGNSLAAYITRLIKADLEQEQS